MALKLPPRGRERRPCLVSNEQFSAQRFFQTLNAHAHCRLRDMQPPGSFDEAAASDHREKRASKLSIHR
ncbi:MAG TPA: hypothetical protein VIZ63_13855 [Povalibacter sp.]